MNTTTALPSSLLALLLPLADRTLLVPQVSMAELVSYRPPQPSDGAPGWCLGQMEWRELRLPLLSFEAASGGQAIVGERCRVAVLNAQGGRERVSFIALLLQGIPRTVRVEPSLEPVDAPLLALEAAAARIGDSVVKIPDFLALEQRLEDAGLV